ncbi:MAG: hypothetical protein RIF32_10970, partial [Leptospirales bacterium]
MKRNPRIDRGLIAPAVWVIIIAAAGAALKLYYSGAPDDEPGWLLAATARSFSIASGIPFEFAEGRGYLSADGRLLLYRGCSGLNFFVLTAFLAGLVPLLLRFERLISSGGAGRAVRSIVAAPSATPLTGPLLYYGAAIPAVLIFTLLANLGRMLALLTLARVVP